MAASPPRALTLAQSFARGEADPVAAVEDALTMAERAPHVFITLTPERARLEAHAAWARLRAGQRRSPLDGVPVAWKDLFDVQGTVTSAGSRVLARQRAVAAWDAPVVARAAGAGLACVGKTNLTEIAYSGLGLNPHFGTPPNPASPGLPRVPGGSSSGSAVAVARGIVPVAVGTDTAGSLRVPAAFNGIVSYRPSRARHDLAGVTPLARSLDTIGPMATSVADCIALDDVMRAGATRPRPSTPSSGLRIVVDTTCLDDERVQPAVRENLLRAVGKLEAAGAQVETRSVECVRLTLRVLDELGWLGAPEAYAEYASLVESEAAREMDPRVRQRVLAAREVTGATVIRLQRERAALIERSARELDGVLVVLPTVAHVAPEMRGLEEDAERFARVNLATLRLTMVGSFLDLPTVALPTGTDAAGQHTGLQVSAPMGDDERLLRGALAMSRLLGIEARMPEEDQER